MTEIEEWAENLRQSRPELDGYAQRLLQAAQRIELGELKRLAEA